MYAQLRDSGCVNRWHGDEQDHGSSIKDVHKWDQLAAAPTQYQPTVDERVARACRTKVAIRTNEPRWTYYHQVHNSPRVQRRFPVELPIHIAGGESAHGRLRKTFSGFENNSSTGNGQPRIGHKVGGAQPFLRIIGVSGLPTLKEPPSLQTGVFRDHTLVDVFSLSPHSPVTVVFVNTVSSRRQTSAQGTFYSGFIV